MQKGIPSEVEDVQLARACLEGNERAQNLLYNTYSRQMMALCLRYARDYDEAQDMFQEGFIKVFQKMKMYKGDGPLGAWIRRVMVNNALDHIRKGKREQLNIEEYSLEFDFEREMEEQSLIEEQEELAVEKLMSLIQQLPTGYRAVFNLFAIEDYGHKDIGEMLGISESTSKTQYRKAKAYMRKLIQEEFNKSLSD